VSTITAEELNAYNAEYADGYPSDEEEEEEMEGGKSDKPSMAVKFTTAVKNFSLPSPEDIKNSNFYKSFQQPLIVKTKVQKPKVLEANQALAADKTPAELSRISKLSEFPLPTFRRMEDKETERVADMNGDEPTEVFEGFGYNSLPRSLRETKLITSVKESNVDDEKLIERMETTKNMTPAQLSEIRSIKDFPIPDKIKHLLDKPGKPPVANGHGPSGRKEVQFEEDEEKEKRPFFSMPESLTETKLITNVKECTDYDTLKKRKALTETKTPKELSAMSGLGDFPIPSRIENLLKKEGGDADASSETNLEPKKMEFSVPPSFKIELAVASVIEEEEVAKKHKELVESTSVAELSKLHSVSDFPIPDVIENLLAKKESTDNDSEKLKSSNLSLSAITSGKILPESLRETKLITNIKVEKDPEKLLARQTLVKNQTPVELGSIKNLHDFPIPARLQNLQLPNFSRSASKKSLNDTGATDSPTAPPRQKSCNASIYESLPSSLRSEMIVRSRPITDEESKSRQELIASKSPVELSQISSLKEFPVPKTIEKLFEKPEGDETDKAGDEPETDFIEKYATLPSSMKTNLLVVQKTEDQELVSQRAETVKSKSVNELSEIKSLSDIPIPSTLTRLAKRDYAPVERKKLFKQQMKSQSTQSLSLQGTLPRSLREKQLLVTSKIEDPEVLSARKAVVESKSVAELSKVSSFADIPVPTFLSKLASRSLTKLHSLSMGHLSDPDAEPKTNNNGIYSNLPKSLNCELLVSKSVQDVSILEERMQLINEKSTKELAEIKSLADFPVPDVVRKYYHKSMDRLQNRPPTEEDEADSTAALGKSMTDMLPSMLTQPCIVKTKVEDPQVLLERQQIQQQKSIHELSKIRNLNEFPVPGNLVKLPDVPIPTMKNMLNMIARPPKRRQSPSMSSNQVPPSETESNIETSQLEEDEYSNLDNMEEGYEVISRQEPPTESPQVEVEPFGLATQIKGTPERNTRSKKKKPDPRNRRSQEEKEDTTPTTTTTTTTSETFETPPPLPPKRSPHKSMSVESQQSFEAEGSPAPVKGVLTLEAMNGNIQVIKNEAQIGGEGGIQSRPLPAPPAPVRYGKVKETDKTLVEESQKFQTCRESLTTTTQSRTLLGTDEDDNTMADSIVESLVSCTDTLICDDDDNDFDDDPYPSVNFESGMSELLESKTQGKRLEEGTQQLSQELMNHVESLKCTLDNMSTRLGARSRSRSSSRPRSTSRTRPMGLHQDKL